MMSFVDHCNDCKVYFRSGETFAFNTNGYSGSQNVGGLYELQGCELCRHHAAVKLGFRWRVRKRLLRIRKLLHNYKKSTGTRKGAVRLWQGDRQLASSRESRQALIRFVSLNSQSNNNINRSLDEFFTRNPFTYKSIPSHSINISIIIVWYLVH